MSLAKIVVLTVASCSLLLLVECDKGWCRRCGQGSYCCSDERPYCCEVGSESVRCSATNGKNCKKTSGDIRKTLTTGIINAMEFAPDPVADECLKVFNSIALDSEVRMHACKLKRITALSLLRRHLSGTKTLVFSLVAIYIPIK